MERYPDEVLWDELTYLAFHLHWSLDELLGLDHRRRNRLVVQVGELERRRAREAT